MSERLRAYPPAWADEDDVDGAYRRMRQIVEAERYGFRPAATVCHEAAATLEAHMEILLERTVKLEGRIQALEEKLGQLFRDRHRHTAQQRPQDGAQVPSKPKPAGRGGIE